jgi:hypothetical protein
MKRSLFIISIISVLVIFGLVAMPAFAEMNDPVFGRDDSAPPTIAVPRGESVGPTWGTADPIMQNISSQGFVPLYSITGYEYDIWGQRYCTALPCMFSAAVHLPSGANVYRLEIWGCDNSAANNIIAYLYACTGPGTTACTLYPSGGLSTSGTPGCGYFYGDFTGPTIANYYNTYFVFVNTGGTGTATEFRALGIYYTLQVSPAPGAATFGDVPTSHPFFQFIEALYGSGITAGCGGGNFCPNDYITRGQMAVWVAAALGLHWPY